MYGGLRGRSPIPYLGEEQIDRGNNDKLQNYLYTHSTHRLQGSVFSDQLSVRRVTIAGHIQLQRFKIQTIARSRLSGVQLPTFDEIQDKGNRNCQFLANLLAAKIGDFFTH